MLEIYNEFKTEDITEGNQASFGNWNKMSYMEKKLPLGLFYNDVS